MNIKIIFSTLLLLVFSHNSYSKTTEIVEKSIEENTAFLKVYDPWYQMNKRIYTFNYYLDTYAALPVTNFYDNNVPTIGKKGITNFYTNLDYIKTITSSTLQGKIAKGMRGLGRLSINSILGLGGFVDVAEKLEMPNENDDFGRLLAFYGVGRGPYLIVPFMGPYNLRDIIGEGIGFAVGGMISPVSTLVVGPYTSMGLLTLEGIDLRNQINFRHYGTSTPFEYEYIRFLHSEIRSLEEKN